MLEKTLDNFTHLDFGALELQIIVVDNNSSDKTYEVCQGFESQLPLTYLFQPKPGKNSALNLALKELELGDVVVFTDDDVCPNVEWFQTIKNSLANYPQYSVFGGPVHMIWPEDAPNWCKSLEKIVYAQHSYNEKEAEYEAGLYPIGPNFWVRSEIFTRCKYKFSESVGPIPNSQKRIMGSETSFLMKLTARGYKIMHIPDARVGHYVTPSQTTKKYVLSRSRTHGRFLARMGHRFSKLDLFRKSEFFWRMAEWMSTIGLYIVFCLSFLNPSIEKRMKKQVFAARWIAYHIELLQNARSIYNDRYGQND